MATRHPLVELTLARFREFLREPEAVFWVFAFPVLLSCALGLAFREQGTPDVLVGVLRDAPTTPGEILTTLEGVKGMRVRATPAASPTARPQPWSSWRWTSRPSWWWAG
jgi:hypothetical protein